MRVAILQYDIQWMDSSANIVKIEALISNENQIDLLVLPEMCLTGFNMNAEEASIKENSKEILDLISLCKKNTTAIIGSFAIVSEENYYNRVLHITADGIKNKYDKQYLFSPSGEDNVYTSQFPTGIFSINGCGVMPQVCYDLRFPESVRTTALPDVIIYMANWPKPRISHWDALLKARAIENQCFVIGCNRIGIDQNKWEFPGHSQLISPGGEITNIDQKSEKLIVDIDHKSIAAYRSKYPFIYDKKPATN